MRWSAAVCAVLACTAHAFAQPAPPPSQPGPPAQPPPQPPVASPMPTDTPPPTPPPAPTAPVSPPAPPVVPPPPPRPVTETLNELATARGNPTESAESAEQRQAAERACAAHEPTCDWVLTFSSLERQSIARAIAARGYQIEPSPWGKVIGKVRVYNENVFAEPNWLRFFNHFHVTTREDAIERALTIGAGDMWDDESVAESARKLHDPLFSSVVALLPVKSAEPGKIDLLVVTRDIWSLRFNTQYTYQQGSLTNLSISISENNFLGRRNVLSAAVLMDQGSIAVGPLFIDKNFLGEHLDFRFRVDEILTRRAPLEFDPATGTFITVPGDPKGLQDGDTLHGEGHDATVSLTRPLWSLTSEWGGGASFTERNAVVRAYTGAAPAPGVDGNPNALFLDPGTGLPYEYRLKTWNVNPYAVRQWGSAFKQQLTFGYVLSSQRPSLLPNFAGDAAQAVQFEADVFPRSEVISQPYVDYSVFTPRYRTIRNVDTYELAEDLRTGPDFDVSLGVGLAALGGDSTFERPGVSAGWTIPWCRDGFVRPSAGISMRFQPGPHNWDSIDNTANATLRAATPTNHRLRVIAQVALQTRWHDTQNQFFTIGSESGLRGYAVSQIRVLGDGRRMAGGVEVRSEPLPIWVLRAGGVLFYDVGGAADSLADLRLFHDVGVGVRLLIPQTSRDLFRFDLAFPLVSALGNPAGSPHFIAGFGSYF